MRAAISDHQPTLHKRTSSVAFARSWLVNLALAWLASTSRSPSCFLLLVVLLLLLLLLLASLLPLLLLLLLIKEG